jgi:cbb3-type cytochrome oxidase maturation protein
MDILPILLLISLVVIALVIWLFFRMSSGGQFDDLEAPARRILLDDDGGRPAESSPSPQQPMPGSSDATHPPKG